MKPNLIKSILVAGVILFFIPGVSMAQDERKEMELKRMEAEQKHREAGQMKRESELLKKETELNKKAAGQAQKEVEQIIITLEGKKAGKTIIELQGEVVTVNGKNLTGAKADGITVQRRKVKDVEALVKAGVPGREFDLHFDMDTDEHARSFFRADSNRAMLGIVTDANPKGAEIKTVGKESAAEKAGLKAGDVIIRINETKIERPEQVAEEIKKRKPGDKVTIAYLRNGQENKTTAELGAWKGIQMNIENFRMMQPPNAPMFPNPDQMPYFRFREGMEGNTPRLGISIQDTEDGKGVKVLEVEEESNAAKAGIKEDDIITRINDKEMKNVDEVSRAVRESREKGTVSMQVLRKGKTQTIEVKIPRRLKTADL